MGDISASTWGDGFFLERKRKDSSTAYEYKKYLKHRDGRLRRKTFVCDTKEECVEKMNHYEEQLKSEPLSSMMYDWVRLDRKNLKENTRKKFVSLISAYIKESELEYADLTNDLVTIFLRDMKQKYAKGTVREVASMLNVYTKNRQDINVNSIFKMVMSEQEDPDPIEGLSYEALEEIQAIIKDRFKTTGGLRYSYGVPILANFYIGLTTSELTNLTWSDVDLVNNEIHIMGKNGKERDVSIPEEARELLLFYKEETAAKREDFGIDYVCYTRAGGKLTYSKVIDMIRTLLKAAGLKYKGRMKTDIMRETALFMLLDKITSC